MNAAMDYIEAHLADEIPMTGRAARLLLHLPFSAHVFLSHRRAARRIHPAPALTLAAFELRGGKCKVIDVALKYGYESPEAFSRAFKKLHGAMPWPRARRAFRSKPIRGCASTSPFRGIKK